MDEKELKWHLRYIKLAMNIAEWSSCLRRQVGAIITIDRRLVSAGYNGAPPGIKSCKETGHCLREGCDSGCQLDNCVAVHAEQNAITSAAKFGIPIKGGDIYTTTFPCVHCMKIIIASGIKRVFYVDEYNSELSVKLAKEAGIELHKLEV